MAHIYFPVAGAGEIRISKDCCNSCGGVVGFGIGVSWGRFGFTGGVISRSEARQMAEYILEVTRKEPTTEKEILDMAKDDLFP